MCPEWALMALPDNGMNPESLAHSAGRVCEQSVPPGFWQHHNSNLSGLSRSRSLNALQPLQACSSEACSSGRVRAESPVLPGRLYEC